MTSTTWDETPVTFTGGGVEIRTQQLGGDMSVLYMRASEGADLSPRLKGLEDDMCQCPHWGCITKGRIALRTAQGEETYETGQTFYWPPGHAPRAVEDSEFFVFSPVEALERTMSHVTAEEAA
ncbi:MULTISPECIES: hypothetical protein [Streptomyces]|uniref:Cupin domain-containing protein n=1 Tax=Streptomyces luteosporeus TaxID=173856 RepID=A0ABP6G4S3_9ACTN